MYGFLSYTGITRRNTVLYVLVVAPQEYVNIYSTRRVPVLSVWRELGFTRYCYYQYGMVHGIHKGVRVGGRILPNSRAMLLQQCGQCSRAGKRKCRLIRAQTTGRTRKKSVKAKGGDVCLSEVNIPIILLLLLQ